MKRVAIDAAHRACRGLRSGRGGLAGGPGEGWGQRTLLGRRTRKRTLRRGLSETDSRKHSEKDKVPCVAFSDVVGPPIDSSSVSGEEDRGGCSMRRLQHEQLGELEVQAHGQPAGTFLGHGGATWLTRVSDARRRKQRSPRRYARSLGYEQSNSLAYYSFRCLWLDGLARKRHSLTLLVALYVAACMVCRSAVSLSLRDRSLTRVARGEA